MDSASFLALFLDNIGIYFFLLSVVAVLFFFVTKRYVRGIIDPLFVNICFSVLANVIPVFLYFTGNIKLEQFLFFCLAETLFWSGFSCFVKKIRERDFLIVINEGYGIALFKICIFIFIVFNLLFFYINGFPLFNENGRFAGMGTNGILFFFDRTIGFVSNYILIFGFYLWNQNRHRKALCLLFFVIVTFFFLRGSKSFILSLVYAYYFYVIFVKEKEVHISYKVLCLIVFTPCMALFLSGKAENFSSTLVHYGIRLIASGDIYWYSLPNNVINVVHLPNPIMNMTNMFWSPFRYLFPFLFNEHDMQFAGETILEFINNGSEDFAGAPNSRVPVLAWIYYGWCGGIFSFLIGMCSSFLIFRLPRLIPKNIFMVPLKGVVYLSGARFLIDPYLGFNSLFNLFLGIMIMIFVYIVYTKSVSIHLKKCSKWKM